MEPTVIMSGVSKNYSNVPAVNNLNLELKGAGIFGVAGPNGSGKTTLLKLMAGLLKPSSGHIGVMDEKVSRLTSGQVAFLSEEESLYPFFTVQEMLTFCGKVISDFSSEKAEEIIEALAVERNKKVKHLSKGNRARVKLALALARQVPVLVLDEPLSGLDPLVREDMIRMIVKYSDAENQMIILSTHEVSEVELFLDQIIIIKEGKCVLNEKTDSLRENKGTSVLEAMKGVLS